VLRRELANLRAAWQSTRSRGAIDDGAVLVTGLHDAVTYRDLIEIRGWAEELAEDFIGDPALAAHPRAAAVLGTAAEAAYHRGDHATAERLARGGLDRATDKFGTWCCLSVLSVVALAGGAHAEVVEHSLAADAIAPRPRDNPGVAALAMAYSGELDRARELQARGRAGAVSPSMRAWNHYVAGEIESLAGDTGAAERHYVRAIELARTAGATFLDGVASVGLVALRGRAGRTADALRGYRDVVDYFARTGNWTHLWPALRNLADLLQRIGDTDPAAALHAAADHAPDAPAIDRGGRPLVPQAVSMSRAEVLQVARDAIERNLSR
jgi:tetratricopeptide (TPR) repeat protein